MIGASSPSLPSLGLEGATICSPVILKQEVTTILTKLLDSNLPFPTSGSNSQNHQTSGGQMLTRMCC